MTAPTAAERVARGAQLLDEKRPGWASRIDLALLDLADECRCVLGQLWGGEAAPEPPYPDALHALGLSFDAERTHGFEIDPGNAGLERMAAYAELDELWIAEIKRRTGGAV